MFSTYARADAARICEKRCVLALTAFSSDLADMRFNLARFGPDEACLPKDADPSPHRNPYRIEIPDGLKLGAYREHAHHGRNAQPIDKYRPAFFLSAQSVSTLLVEWGLLDN